MIDIKKVCESRFKREEEYLGTNKLINQINPLVSVTVTTYQHANYIKDCLEGILMQKTNFPFEIIIGEDESTDGTREICIEYAEKYPDKIRLFLRKRETSQLYDENGKFITRFNGHWNRMSARGKYIAWCEGDDYWTDPYKLQKQVDFLEANPEYSMCFHNAFNIYENSTKKPELFNDIFFSREVTINEIVNKWIIPTASIVFKRDDILPLPAWSKNIYSGDMTLALIAVSKGKLFCLNSVMSVYRINLAGSSMTAIVASRKFDFLLKEHIKLYNFYLNDPLCINKKIIEDKIHSLKKELKFQQLKHKNYVFAFIRMPSYFLKKLKYKIRKNNATY